MYCIKATSRCHQSGDNIRAVIRNTGINQDGRTVGISTPSAEAQARLVRPVYESAHLDPRHTSYIEAHGTGTTVGDPLEATAFKTTFISGKSSQEPTYLGSAKSNFGHLEGASGIVSVIKTAMMLEKHIILPNANFETPNPKITSLGKTMKVCIQIMFFLKLYILLYHRDLPSLMVRSKLVQIVYETWI